MSALGILPKVDAVIHADTTHERSETYAFARKWTPWLEEHGIRVVTAVDEKATQAIYRTNQTHIPAFTFCEEHMAMGYYDVGFDEDGNDESVWVPYKSPKMVPGYIAGMLNRSCTQRWKIAPIHRWLQANRNGEQVEQWLGITLDEVGRMTTSNVGYVDLKYPFIEMLDRPLDTRYGCAMAERQRAGSASKKRVRLLPLSRPPHLARD